MSDKACTCKPIEGHDAPDSRGCARHPLLGLFDEVADLRARLAAAEARASAAEEQLGTALIQRDKVFRGFKIALTERDQLRKREAALRAAVEGLRAEMIGIQAAGAPLVARSWIVHKADAILAEHGGKP